jgi:hypothetical protein
MEMKWRMVQWFFAVAPAFSAVSSLEAVLGDIPSEVWWAPAIQGVEELQHSHSDDSCGSSSSLGV